MKDGFTLTELIIVTIIIGILVTLGIVQYYPSRERALGREANANLRLISAAERIYRMEAGGYYPIPAGSESDITDINNFLRLSITEANWDYSITSGGAPPSTFTASGDRQGAGGYLDCQYSITQAQDDPTGNASCLP